MKSVPLKIQLMLKHGQRWSRWQMEIMQFAPPQAIAVILLSLNCYTQACNAFEYKMITKTPPI